MYKSEYEASKNINTILFKSAFLIIQNFQYKLW